MSEQGVVRDEIELYARMAEPYADQDLADAAVRRFILEVEQLRQKSRVAEVVLVAAAYFDGNGKKGLATIHGMALGSSEAVAQLAEIAYIKHALGPASPAAEGAV